MTIKATGINEIILIEGNIVNAEFVALHSKLSNLKSAVSQSFRGEAKKLDILVNILRA